MNLNVRFERKLFVRVGEGASATTESLVSEDNSGVFILNRVPKKCSVHLQGHTQAATYKIVLDYRELPIDPRTIVACSVEVHMGTVSAQDFADGMNREVAPGRRASILRTRNQDGRLNDENLVMIGPADDWRVEYGPDGAEVHLEGRDLRGVLLDSPLLSERDAFDYDHRRFPERRKKRSNILSRINLDVHIHKVVEQILREHDVIRRLPEPIEVVSYPDEWPGGELPSPGARGLVPRHRRGAGGQGSSAGGAFDNMNFWDLITRLCYLVGAVPTFQGRRLYIRPGRALFNDIRNGRRTPFHPNSPRSMEGMGEWHVRRLIYGRDVTDMKLARKYAGNNKPKSIRCICHNLSSGRRGRESLLEVVWPPRTEREARREGVQGDRRTVRDSLGGQESQEVVTIPVRGRHNIQQLTAIAQSYYEQMGRNEIKVEVSAARLTSFGGNNADPDLLRLRVGDTIELLVDASATGRSGISSTVNEAASLGFSEAVERVRARVQDRNLARAIVASALGNIMGVLRYYYVAGVDLDWSYEEISVKMDLMNYWIPRQDYLNTEARQQHRSGQHADRHRAAHATHTLRQATHPANANMSVASPTRTRTYQDRADLVPGGRQDSLVVRREEVSRIGLRDIFYANESETSIRERQAVQDITGGQNTEDIPSVSETGQLTSSRWRR